MIKIFILIAGLFLFTSQSVFSQPDDRGLDIEVERGESVVQQGRDIQVDQVEINEEIMPIGTSDDTLPPGEVVSDENGDLTPGRGPSRGHRGMEAIRTQSSEVAQYVQELLNDPNLENTEIGQQVRQVAMEQNQAQEQIQENVRAIESRGQVMRFFFGSNQRAVEGLENQLQQTQQRLAQLEEFSNQAPTEDIRARIQMAMTALEEQSEALSEAIIAERQVRGVFGFLFRFFEN